MLGKLLAAEVELGRQVSALRAAHADGNALSGCEEQLSALEGLRASVSSASGAELAAICAQVTSAVAASRTATQAARDAVSDATASAGLTAITAAARQEAQSLSADLFERHIFDSYLQFDSQKDRDAYRQREEETKRYVAEQMARHSPEGVLNAGGAEIRQMADAHDHGAGNSREFLPRWHKLVETVQKQRDAMHAEGRSTEEFDRYLKNTVRQCLMNHGLSEAEINARLASTADPLDLLKPYMENDKDAQSIKETVNRSTARANFDHAQVLTVMAPHSGEAATTVAERAQASPELGSLMATLQDSGVVVDSKPIGDSFAHGVATTRPAAKAASAPTPG